MRALSRGALAGAIGTAVMSVAQAVEMRITGRPPSLVPGQVGARIAGLDPDGIGRDERFSLAVHWMHGIANGTLRGLMGEAGLGGARAAAIHFGMLWATDATLYRALGVAGPPWTWTIEELRPDVLHKGIYCLATGAAYDRLAR